MWHQFLNDLHRTYDFTSRAPLEMSIVLDVLSDLRIENVDFVSFYCVTNGLQYKWLEILPIENAYDVKHTWNGLVRANRPDNNVHLGGSAELLDRFLVFAIIGDNQVGVVDRSDWTIWYEENNDLHQTDLSLSEFIELCMKEADELT